MSAEAFPEQPVWFDAAGEPLLGILHAGAAGAQVGVVVVVGGPQYRIGSHRQFVLLARAVAAAGFPVLRFDYRGLGDSGGDVADFTAIDDDIEAAIRVLRERSGVERVVLWGLCDAASAILLHARRFDSAAAWILLNPWVHTEQAEAEVRLKHYYLRRLTSRDFWQKLLRLRLDLGGSLRDLAANLRGARGGGGDEEDYIAGMLAGLRRRARPLYLVMSGDDMTAEEFRQLRAASADWRAALDACLVDELALDDANHTFARAAWRDRVAGQTIAWLEQIAQG